MQTRKRSWKEAWTNIFIGYTINFTANALILPFLVEGFTYKKNLMLGVIYTGISLLRTYCIRRWFNKAESNDWKGIKKPKELDDILET